MKTVGQALCERVREAADAQHDRERQLVTWVEKYLGSTDTWREALPECALRVDSKDVGVGGGGRWMSLEFVTPGSSPDILLGHLRAS